MPDHQKPSELVIEGAGSVVGKFYLPALERLRTEGVAFGVTFVDDSHFWKHDSRLAADMNARIANIRNLGTYLDKSEPGQFRQSRTLQPETVVIATPDRTHVTLTLDWLNRDTLPNGIYIEKPLDTSICRVRELLGVVGAENSIVRAFDHYRAKLLPSRAEFDMLNGFLKAGIARFTFYLLEDLSGADPAYKMREGDRQGPIENENRVAALRDGCCSISCHMLLPCWLTSAM